MADTNLSFTYRLPLTYVRVVGEVRTTKSSLPGEETTSVRELAVTTEVGADLLTAIRIDIDAASMATQKATWTLLPDGRLTGSSVSTTVEPLAGWKAALQVGAFVAAAAGAVASGPPGWASLGLAALGAVTAASVTKAVAESLPAPTGTDRALQALDPTTMGVRPEYVVEHEVEARVLGAYRFALAAGSAAHAEAALGLAGPDPAATAAALRELDKALQSVRLAAAVSEAAYTRWLDGKRTTDVTTVDERLRIDDMPTSAELRGWAAGGRGELVWTALATTHRVAISVDLASVPEADSAHEKRRAGEPYMPELPRDILFYRPPRWAEVTVWNVTPTDEADRYTLTPKELVRMAVSYAGNETALNLATPGSTSAVTAAFDENGALTSLATEVIDPRLQRAREIGELPEALKGAATAGADVGKLFAGPTLVERAAEAKAAAELGLVPTPPDPLQALRDQLEKDRLIAQSKIAHQLATSSSPLAIVVRVDESGL